LAFPRLGKGGRQRYAAVVAIHLSKTKMQTRMLVAFFHSRNGRKEMNREKENWNSKLREITRYQ
jgi:hypothetical protein